MPLPSPKVIKFKQEISFVVRVSPTNAVLTPEMISLTNSQGQNLNEFLSVQKVEKYKGY